MWDRHSDWRSLAVVTCQLGEGCYRIAMIRDLTLSVLTAVVIVTTVHFVAWSAATFPVTDLDAWFTSLGP